MKKLFVIAMVAIGLTIFNGCKKEEPVVTDEQPQVAVKPDVYVENGYLAFKNMETVDSVIHVLNKMNSQEKEIWENEMGYKSARVDFDILFEEYDNLKSYEEFLAFKKRNHGKLKFNELDDDDCSIDYPFATGYFLPILNSEGIYKVGKSIIKYTMDDQIIIADGDINKLNNLSASMADENVIIMPKLKSIDNNFTDIHFFPEDDPSGNGDKWHTKDEIHKRRINHKLVAEQYIYTFSVWDGYAWVDNYKNGIKVFLNQRGQKYSWGKWRDYKTTYGIKEIKCQVGSYPTREDVRIHISAEVKPSINFYLHNNFVITSYYPSSYLTVPCINFAANVTFRGFGFNTSNYYTIENPESYTPAGTNNYPTENWGW